MDKNSHLLTLTSINQEQLGKLKGEPAKRLYRGKMESKSYSNVDLLSDNTLLTSKCKNGTEEGCSPNQVSKPD